MIELRGGCDCYDTVRMAERNLIDFLEFMDYTYKGYIQELPPWRRHDYKYYLELGLTDVPDCCKIIQGAFDDDEEWKPVFQIKRYLLLNTHLDIQK